MNQYYVMGNSFYKATNKLVKESLRQNFKSKKKLLSAKERELITKFRKGLIWKDI